MSDDSIEGILDGLIFDDIFGDFILIIIVQ